MPDSSEPPQHQPGPTYDQRGQQVGTQYNIAGNLFADRSELESLTSYLAQAIPATLHDLQLRALRPYALATSAHPYKFLYAFTLEDAARFSGRDDAIAALAERIQQHRLTVLHARSGAGKSSLLQAGLQPSLLRSDVVPLVVRTTDDPLLALKRTLAPPSFGPWPSLMAKLSLHAFLGMACAQLNRRVRELVIIFDQFEEFLVATPDHATRQPFIDALGDCYDDAALPVRFLVSVRGDYFTELAAFQTRLPHIFYNEYHLEALGRDAARQAIVQPLLQLDPPCHYAPDLLDTLLDDLTANGLELPQLQIVCTRLYAALQPGETVITQEHYQHLGTTTQILGTYLHQTVEQLGQFTPLARAILLELTGSGQRRQRIDRGQLHQRLIQRSDLPLLDQVLPALVRTRLVQPGSYDGVISYELAHDSLLPALRAWVTPADLAARRAHERIQQALIIWREDQRLLDPGTLQLITEQRDGLANLSHAALELLLRSAVAHQIALEPWIVAAHRQGHDIWPLLQPLLEAADDRVRARAIALLAVVGAAAIPFLRRAVHDRMPLVRTHAILALEQLGTPEAEAILQTGLRNERAIVCPATRRRWYMDRVPVTAAAYQVFLEDQPAQRAPEHWQHRTAPTNQRNHPVTGVSWHDAQAYAAWAGRRLPTRQEWQQAAGGDYGYRYPWGHHFAAQHCNTVEARLGSTTPVGAFSPAGDSPYGIADLAGNVWEWLIDPAGVEATHRHVSGGAWMYSMDFARIDGVACWRPAEHTHPALGFRLCFDQAREKEL
jgi:hypothetical protein